MKRTILAMVLMVWAAPAAFASDGVTASEVLAPEKERTFISAARVGEILAALFADARTMFGKQEYIAPIEVKSSNRRVGVSVIAPQTQAKQMKHGLVPPVELAAKKRSESKLEIGSSRQTAWDAWEHRDATFSDLDYRNPTDR